VDFSHTGISLYIIYLAGSSSIAAVGGGAQRPIFRVNEHKKMGAQSTRAHKIRPVNSAFLVVILFVCLSVCLSVLAERCFIGWNSNIQTDQEKRGRD
jgi:hypothetical protein